MDLQTVQATVERACMDINRPDARAAALTVLEQFQLAPDLAPACEHILANSTLAPAQFQAAVALAKRIRTMSSAEREPVRVRILQLIAGRSEQLENYVTAQLLRALAVTLSAGCRDGTFAQALPVMMTDIRNMSANTVAMRQLGLKTAAAIFEEFEDQSTDAMAQAHVMLEQSGAVLQLEEIALGQLQQLLEPAASPSRAQWRAALQVVLGGLSWDWGAKGKAESGREDDTQLEARCVARAHNVLHDCWSEPSKESAPLLANPALLQLLLSAHTKLRTEQALSRQVRMAFLHLCSMRGPVFSSDQMRVEHIARLLHLALDQLGSLPADSGCPAQERLDWCTVVGRLVSAAKVRGVLSCTSLQAALPKLAAISGQVLMSCPYDDEQPWERLEAFDCLLDGWVSLSTDRDAPPQFAQQLAPAATALLSQFVAAALSQTMASAEECGDCYEEDIAEEERLVGVACVARVAPATTCSALATAITQRLAAVVQSCSTVRRALSAALLLTVSAVQQAVAEATLLVQLAAYVLSDSAEGELPELPECFGDPSTTEGAMGLTAAVFEVVGMMVQCNNNAAVLPLSLALGHFLGRWCTTWLWLQDNGSQNGALHSHFGTGTAPAQYLAALLRVAEVWVRQLSVAPSLGPCVVQLLQAVVSRKVVQRQLVLAQEWWSVVAVLLPVLPSLKPQQIRQSVMAVLRGSSCDAANCEAHVWPALMASQLPEVMCEVGRGAAMAVQVVPSECRASALQRAASMLPALSQACLAQLGSTKLASRVLKLASAVMESSGLMGVSDAALSQLVTELFCSICTNLQKLQQAAGIASESEAFEGEFSIVAALLLTAEAAVEYDGVGGSMVQQVTAALLQVTRPTVLQVPKVQHKMFRMLDEVAHGSVTSLLQLHPQIFASVLTVLDGGLQLPQRQLQMQATGVVAALAVSSLTTNGAAHSAAAAQNVGAFSGWAMQKLIAMLVFEARSTASVIDSVADSVHALALYDPSQYSTAATQVLAQVSAAHQQAICQLLSSLVPTHGAHEFNRITKANYRRVCVTFVTNIQQLRGLEKCA